MATEEQYLEAQEEACQITIDKPYFKYLMKPTKMRKLLKEEKELEDLKNKGTWYETIYRDILNFILSGNVPKSKLEKN